MTKELYSSKLEALFAEAEKHTANWMTHAALDVVHGAAKKHAEKVIAAMPDSVSSSASTAAFDWNTFLTTIQTVLSQIPQVGPWVMLALTVLRIFVPKS